MPTKIIIYLDHQSLILRAWDKDTALSFPSPSGQNVGPSCPRGLLMLDRILEHLIASFHPNLFVRWDLMPNTSIPTQQRATWLKDADDACRTPPATSQKQHTLCKISMQNYTSNRNSKAKSLPFLLQAHTIVLPQFLSFAKTESPCFVKHFWHNVVTTPIILHFHCRYPWLNYILLSWTLGPKACEGFFVLSVVGIKRVASCSWFFMLV